MKKSFLNKFISGKLKKIHWWVIHDKQDFLFSLGQIFQKKSKIAWFIRNFAFSLIHIL